jgi:DHA1 family tetracycline resistance protein-like MFS transporter
MLPSNSRAIRFIVLSEILEFLALAILVPVIPPLIVGSDSTLFAPDTTDAYKNIVYGFLIAIFSVAQFFSAPIFGILSDKHGRKKILVFAMLFTLTGYIVSAISVYLSYLPLLFIGRILTGFGFGSQSILFSAVADISNNENKAKNYGLLGVAFGISFIFGPATGGLLSSKFALDGNRFLLPFLVSIVLIMLNIILVASRFPETNLFRRTKAFNIFAGVHNIQKALKNPQFNILFLIVLTTGFGFNFFREFIQLYLLGKFDFQSNDLGKYFSFIGITAAITQGGIVRILSKRFAPEKVITVALPMLSTCLLLLIFPDKVWQLFAITFFLSMSQALIFPNVTALISNKAGQENQGEILGINQSVNSVAQAIPPIIGGFVVSIQLSVPLIIASALTITGWCIFLYYRFIVDGRK